eukprot:TRINITY_DN4076_c0_g1_i1.p1 TRINITY_DN4076_c0_g1~~TRINITY_DN4076_c0_g1_i1.p1  ORF type:complete len:460 (+),score=60.27 TRINITY_DN4076_c0_g1_i1:113-1492(+)
MSITSDEVNYLLFRYLQEAGFSHTAFSFANESLIHKAGINHEHVPPGALISFLQKGLQYLEVETHVKEDGTEIECEKPFSLLDPHVCTDKKAKASRKTIRAEEAFKLISNDNIVPLVGHHGEVFCVMFNPSKPIIATGCGDSTARLWTAPALLESVVVLEHDSSQKSDVTAVDWNQTGTLLVTGCYDGVGRIWGMAGDPVMELRGHSRPIFSVKWNAMGSYVLSGSVDHKAIVFEAATGKIVQEFNYHDGPVMDVSWRNNDTFATASTDKVIYMCKVGEKFPIMQYRGHEADVNSIRWSPCGRHLASCSDDKTAKIWSPDRSEATYTLTGHLREVHNLRWSPTGRGSHNPNSPLYLATCSFDGSVRLWDPETGNCVQMFKDFDSEVNCVEFSPNGKMLAAGSYKGEVLIYNIQSGSLLRKIECEAAVHVITWDSTSTRVSISQASESLVLADLRLVGTA